MASDSPTAPSDPVLDADHATRTLRAAADKGVPAEFDAHVERLRALLGDELETIEAELPDHLQTSIYPLVETGRHLLASGGKRIRPILTLLCAHAVGHPGVEARKLAAAGELVHLATLLHDDVIDDADLRRGQPTPRVVWSNTASVLGGDYALTRALDLVGSVDVDAPLREAIRTLRSLVEGEILQLSHRGRAATTVADYVELAERKTASLFRWCCRAGAHLGGDPHQIDAFGEYGAALGLGFQVVDDILDYSDSAETTGKEPLADLREGKPTLPLLVAMDRSASFRDDVAHAFETGTALQGQRVFRALHETGALDHTREVARGHATSAITHLHRVPASAYRDALERIAGSLAARVA
jgi:octaprenyl-diphosphate synthase